MKMLDCLSIAHAQVEPTKICLTKTPRMKSCSLAFSESRRLGRSSSSRDRILIRVFKKEAEKVFLKTWQYAVHEDEIPNPGDTISSTLHKSS